MTEINCWAQAAESLAKLSTVYASQESQETIGRVNRLISQWSSDDNSPSDGYDNVKSTYKKLASGLNDIKVQAEKEAK